MQLSVLDCILIGICVTLTGFVFDLFMRTITPKPQVPPMGPKPVIANILSELDLLIDMEIVGVINVPLMVKEIPLIQDFKNMQSEITHNVIESLSTNFFLECNKAGIKRAYIITYVTRRTNVKMLEFMQQHNYSLK